MAVSLRLQRHGATHRPFYKLVVTDNRKVRDGRFIEALGTYDSVSNPHKIAFKLDRIEHWIGLGAVVSDTVKSLIVQAKEKA
jgi:small subunit ribosomal protein S16